MPKIAFLLQTHDANPHLERLTAKLLEFGGSKIFCHHDFSKGRPHSAITKSAYLCKPSINTEWGKTSQFLAELNVIQLAYDKMPEADWFILLSGSCYPIKSVDYILKYLDLALVDGFMDMNKAKPGLHLARWWWKKVLTRPLCKIPFISKRGKFYWRELRLKRTEHPFSSKMPLMFGSNWFILNKKTISQLLAMNLQQHQLVKFYDEVERAENRHMSPDESILQCLLTDETKFKIDRNYLRFIDWQDSVEWHPNILTEKHWEAIQNSDALFARKFSFPSSNKVLDLIDTYNN